VGVAAEIPETVLWPPQGRLAVGHPILMEEGTEESRESLGFCNLLRVNNVDARETPRHGNLSPPRLPLAILSMRVSHLNFSHIIRVVYIVTPAIRAGDRL